MNLGFPTSPNQVKMIMLLITISVYSYVDGKFTLITINLFQVIMILNLEVDSRLSNFEPHQKICNTLGNFIRHTDRVGYF